MPPNWKNFLNINIFKDMFDCLCKLQNHVFFFINLSHIYLWYFLNVCLNDQKQNENIPKIKAFEIFIRNKNFKLHDFNSLPLFYSNQATNEREVSINPIIFQICGDIIPDILNSSNLSMSDIQNKWHFINKIWRVVKRELKF